jgi:hypothetical protein
LADSSFGARAVTLHGISWPLATAGVVFVWLQQGAAPLFARISQRISGRWFGTAKDGVDVLQERSRRSTGTRCGSLLASLCTCSGGLAPA